ncbi:hypothetical protein LSM04_001546 [Trypanosoma melophagium]|uniref:uncharacterized protein n=1 Tax=Trypanosoma melophagium TaxID=715481 RepID=UPI00351A6229|nr:hypothetical protein LSM04_001546 [Trypanosoma melophagium]
MLTSLTRGFPQQQQQRETPVGADETELCELRRSTLLQDEELDKLRRAQKELNAQLGKLKHAKKDLERVREENVKLHAQLKERADSTKELEDLRQENKKLNAKLEELAHLRNELSDLRLLNDELRAQLERQPAELLVSLSPRGEGESRDEPLAEELIEVPRTRLVAVEEVAEAAGEAAREMLTSLTRGFPQQQQQRETPVGADETELCELRRSTLLQDEELDKLRRAQKELNAQLGKLKHAKKDLERVREENVKLHAQLKERADSTKELEDLRQENKKLNAKLEELAHLRNELSDLRLLNDELRAQLERQPAELLVSLSPRGEGESRDEPLAEELIEVPRTRLVAVEEVAEAAGEAPREMLTSLTREFPQQQQQRETPVGADETELCELRRSTLLQDEELDKLRRAQKELNAQLGKLKHAKKDLERVREENVKLHAQLKERADSTKELEDLRQENKKLNAKLEELAHLRNELSDLRLLNDELRAQLERQPAELLVSLSPRGEGESRDEPLAEELIEVPRTRLVAVEEVAEAAGEAPREMLTSLTREFPQQQQQRETPRGCGRDGALDKLRRAQKELNAQLGKLKHAKKDLERVREENVKLHAQLKERADSTKELEDLRQENKKLNAKLEELAHLRNELSDLRLLNDELRAQLERQPAELLVSLSPRGEGESRDEPLAEELIEVPRTRLVAVEEVAEAAGEAAREMLTSLTREFPQQQQQRETPVGADETELCELRRSTLLQDEELDKLRRAQKELNAQLGKLKHAKKDLERVREENVKLHAQLKERADSTKELEDLRQENKKLNAKLEELAHLRNELSDLRLLNDELRAQLERQPAELLVSLSPRGEGESRDEPLAEELIEVPRTRLVAVEEVAEAAGEAAREMLTSLTREFPQQQQQRETPVGVDETELCELRRSTLLQDEELDKLRRAQKELNAQLGKLKHAKKDLERVREENVKLHAQLKERADSTKELEDLRQENKKLNAKLEELAHLRNELSDLRLLNDELRAQLERQPAELLVSLSPRGEGESRDEPLAEELIEVPRTRLVAVEEVAEAAGEAPREMLTSLTRGSLSSNSSGRPPWVRTRRSCASSAGRPCCRMRSWTSCGARRRS